MFTRNYRFGLSRAEHKVRRRSSCRDNNNDAVIGRARTGALRVTTARRHVRFRTGVAFGRSPSRAACERSTVAAAVRRRRSSDALVRITRSCVPVVRYFVFVAVVSRDTRVVCRRWAKRASGRAAAARRTVAAPTATAIRPTLRRRTTRTAGGRRRRRLARRRDG